MDFKEHHKAQVNKIRTEQKFAGGGAEQEIFTTHDPRYIVKISTGTLLEIQPDGGVHESRFDPEHVPKEIRKQLLAQHLLAKILHTLLPSSVPDRKDAVTKSLPRYRQDKIEGVKHGDDVPRRVTHVEENQNFQKEAGRLRIKSIAFTEVAPEGQKADEAWRSAIQEFSNTMHALGISIDTRNMFENFMRTADGNYVYIDSFSFHNARQVAEKLRNAITQASIANVIPEKDCDSALRWLDQFSLLTAENASDSTQTNS